MAIVKAQLNEEIKKRIEGEKDALSVSLDAQQRLAEILNDSPRLVSLNGTPWEVRALRMGTQWLMAQKIIEIDKSETGTFGDVMRHFAVNIPAVLDILTLCLLNDRYKIYQDGEPTKGFSDLYRATRSTLEWDCDVSQFGNLLFEVFQMIDVSFFTEALDMLQIFRATVTEKKRMRKKERK